ncbi:DUF6428 family protein [Maribacter sp.]|nr:DUF6428 family protein [Maribacter sp.]
MKTNEFLGLLKAHTDKSLLFEYKEGYFVGANYHITEIKNITVDSVDCGAQTDFWKETVIQLWESPDEHDKEEYLTTNKALGILIKVDQIKPMEKDVEVKFEYSNDHFHTAQLFVNDFSIDADKLILKLGVEKTDCKARETCGVPVEASVQADSSCCTPESGCC